MFLSSLLAHIPFAKLFSSFSRCFVFFPMLHSYSLLFSLSCFRFRFQSASSHFVRAVFSTFSFLFIQRNTFARCLVLLLSFIVHFLILILSPIFFLSLPPSPPPFLNRLFVHALLIRSFDLIHLLRKVLQVLHVISFFFIVRCYNSQNIIFLNYFLIFIFHLHI